MKLQGRTSKYRAGLVVGIREAPFALLDQSGHRGLEANRIFNFPGMGAVLVDAIRNRDAPLVATVVALTGSAITVVLVASDLVRAWALGHKP
jgi:ABC-type microcin C transport system permease subunit YejB